MNIDIKILVEMLEAKSINWELLASNAGTRLIINQAIKGISNPEEILIVNHLRVALMISDYILSNKIK